MQITSVRKAGLTIQYMRACDSGHRKVSVVRIKRVNFRENILAFVAYIIQG